MPEARANHSAIGLPGPNGEELETNVAVILDPDRPAVRWTARRRVNHPGQPAGPWTVVDQGHVLNEARPELTPQEKAENIACDLATTLVTEEEWVPHAKHFVLSVTTAFAGPPLEAARRLGKAREAVATALDVEPWMVVGHLDPHKPPIED